MKFRTLLSQIGKPRTVAEALAGRDTKAIAAQFGVSRRTAQKWKAGTQQPGKNQGGAPGVLKRLDTPATRRRTAANAVRNASGAHVGRVQVIDKSPRGRAASKPSFRNVGTVSFDNLQSREKLNAVAEAIEARDYERADQLMGEAVLTTPGKDYGSALAIEDWPAGFHLF